MLRKFILIAIILLCISSVSHAQTGLAIGKVTDSATQLPIKGAHILVMKADSSINMLITDSLGQFFLSKELYLKYTRLEISANEYKRYLYIKRNIIFPPKGNLRLGTIGLKSVAIDLGAVIIKKRRKYRDTAYLDLSANIYSRDQTVLGLLSGQNGFSRSIEGKLTYKGKDVGDLVVDGGTFFGKNNIDIFRYLPAGVLEGVEIIETDLDSVSNTVMSKPIVKLNLKLKEAYRKGKFGSIGMGYGTSNRYMGATDLYAFSGKRQISAVLSSNNIDLSDNPFADPSPRFSSNGNNRVSSSAKLTLRDVFFNSRLELNVEGKGSLHHEGTSYEMTRLEQETGRSSKATSDARSRAFSIESSTLKAAFKPSPLKDLVFLQSYAVDHSKSLDSLYYEVIDNKLLTVSSLHRQRSTFKSILKENLEYRQRSKNNMGKNLFSGLEYTERNQDVSESSRIKQFSTASEGNNLKGTRLLGDRSIVWVSRLTLPLGDNGYLAPNLRTSFSRLLYSETLNSDSLSFNNRDSEELKSMLLYPGLDWQRTISTKLSVKGSIRGILGKRGISSGSGKSGLSTVDMEAEGKLDFNPTKNETISLQLTRIANFPSSSQLTSIENTFDLISQSKGNIGLDPEVRNRAEGFYSYKSRKGTNISVLAALEYFSKRFGAVVYSQEQGIQYNSIANLGGAHSLELVLAISGNVFDKSPYSYRNSLLFQKTPTYVLGNLKNNSGLSWTQAVSLSSRLFGIIGTGSSINCNLSSYSYSGSSSRTLSFTYADRLAYSIPNVLGVYVYPVATYTKGLGQEVNWAVNGEIKLFAKGGRGFVWARAYDIFNSFSYQNNMLGSFYTQSTTFENLSRYIIFGATIRFDNMK